MPEILVRTHYLRYLEFLKRKEYLAKDLPVSADGWDGELWSNELTPMGYRFVQYSHDRWIGRILKYKDVPSANAYLDKWHNRFLQLPSNTFARHDA